MRIGSKIIINLSKPWKGKFSILCDVIFLVRLQDNFELDHSYCLELLHLQPYAISEQSLPLCASLNPFTPKSDQVQISPVASPVILHHTVWRTWLFIAYSDWKMILVPVLTTSLIHFSWKGWENVLFELGSERVNPFTPKSDQFQIFPAASPEILHHTVWRNWLFIAYSDESWLYYQFSLHRYFFSLGRLGECSF